MPKNLKGGNKHKKMKNNSNSNEITSADLVLKTDKDQDYGKVDKILGNGRFTILCNDKIKRLGIIRGNMRKKKWINLGNIILYSIRPYEKDKVDIIHVYENNILKMLQHKMDLQFNISNETNDDDIFLIDNDTIIEEHIIPEKKPITNTYYNFSDSESDSDSDSNNYSENNNMVNDKFIDDL